MGRQLTGEKEVEMMVITEGGREKERQGRVGGGKEVQSDGGEKADFDAKAREEEAEAGEQRGRGAASGEPGSAVLALVVKVFLVFIWCCGARGDVPLSARVWPGKPRRRHTARSSGQPRYPLIGSRRFSYSILSSFIALCR